MSHQIRGNHCAMVTPFTEDGRIDEPSLERLVRHLLAEGVHGLLVVGTTGEGFNLEVAERMHVAERVLRWVNGAMPVGVMIGYAGTRTSIELGRHAMEVGADYVLVPPPPSAFPLSGSGLAGYYIEVAREVDLPVMVYDGGGGTEVSLQVWQRMLDETDNVRYAKVSVQDPPKIAAILEKLGGRVQPFAGKEETVLPMLGNGAVGMVSGAANVVPADVSAVFDSYVGGDKEAARHRFYSRVNPLVTMAFPARNEFIQCLKQVLHWQGVIDSPATRHPLPRLDGIRIEELRGAFEFAFAAEGQASNSAVTD